MTSDVGMPGAVTALPASAAPASGTKYRRALAAWTAWSAPERELPRAAWEDQKQLPVVSAALRKMQEDLPALATALRETEFAVSAADVATITKALDETIAYAQQHGAAAMKDEPKLNVVIPGFARITQLFDAGQKLVDRASVEEEAAAPKDARPLSVEPDRTIYMPDGSEVSFPGSLKVPDWLKQSPAWKRWEVTGDIRTMTTSDSAGNGYAIALQGRMQNPDGTSKPLLATIQMRRPNGTLAAVTDFGFDRMTGWKTLDAAGKQYAWWAEVRGNESNAERLWRIRHFDFDGSAECWTYSYHNQEWAYGRVDPIGIGLPQPKIGERAENEPVKASRPSHERYERHGRQR